MFIEKINLHYYNIQIQIWRFFKLDINLKIKAWKEKKIWMYSPINYINTIYLLMYKLVICKPSLVIILIMSWCDTNYKENLNINKFNRYCCGCKVSGRLWAQSCTDFVVRASKAEVSIELESVPAFLIRSVQYLYNLTI